MKSLITAGTIACLFALTACASPELPADGADAREAENAKVFEQEKGEMLTGSRIPVKTTTHSMRRTGGKELRKEGGGGQNNPEFPKGGER
ncbi:hypothetical protein [Massilia cavernae]|uniref:Lipoprotein n=1 Tax=Massilia cavernae TaxID=2320864 RepID=A0A418XAD2_9BURK|nr:hypothetical protein [Massilia cavernae]RJG09456.1 hypothetical protein D3872_22715 [Massilia cavernae]